jgi:Arc/MetJ-type ribon-helix-helix transcriptional regulator
VGRGVCLPLRFGLGYAYMSTLTLELPEALTAELDAAVEEGWFTSQAEAVRAAVRDFVNHRKLDLMEQQQLSDVEWAVKLAKQAS